MVVEKENPGSNDDQSNEPPADGPSSGSAGEESASTGETSQDKPGGSESNGKQSPN